MGLNWILSCGGISIGKLAFQMIYIAYMLRKLMTGLSSLNAVNPTPIMEQPKQVNSLPQKNLVELNTEFKLNRPLFYWNFFKLHFLLDKMVYSHGFYCIIHQDGIVIQTIHYYTYGVFFADGTYVDKYNGKELNMD